MPVDLTIAGQIATITLRRPEALNAINSEMRGGLHAAWNRISSDDGILVAIITGEGDKAFCVGSDLKETLPAWGAQASVGPGESASQHLLQGLETDKPLICAINGHALGGGLEIALACDIRITAPDAKFGLPEVKVGSMPGAGGTQLLPRTVGRSMAMQMLLTGDLIDSDTALRWGLVSEIHQLDNLVNRASHIASRIAANAPLSVRATKRVAKEGADLPLPAGMDLERHAFGILRDTEDRLEGRRAFRESRDPIFQGR